MLDQNLIAQLSAHMDKVVQPIELIATLDESPKAAEVRELLSELAELSPNITARFDGTGDRAPAFNIARTGTDIRVTFGGVPLGHEFTSLFLALLHVGGHPPTWDDQLIRDVQALDGDYHFETYMSLSCQNCPDVVQALNTMSALNPRIKHTAIDGGVFPEEVTERNIQAVPTVFLNGVEFGQGRMTPEEILAKMDTGAAAKATERLNELDPFEVLVVGGGPAGASAAIYSARKGIRTGILTTTFGGQVQDTVGIENFISVPYTEGPKLVAAMEAHVAEYDVEVIRNQVAAGLTPAGGDGLIRVATESGATLSARSVVVATGARWRMMGVPGEAEYRNKGVTFCPHCDGPLFKGKRVAVIGGGNSGVEAAIDLAGIVGHVTLIEFMDQMRADEVLQRKLRSLPNVDVLTNTATTEVLGAGQGVTGLALTDRATEETSTLPVSGVFVQIGLLPNTEWLADSVELSDRREVQVDARCATNVPGVFAAGDCTTVPYKQIVISTGHGATAALSAFDHLIRS